MKVGDIVRGLEGYIPTAPKGTHWGAGDRRGSYILIAGEADPARAPLRGGNGNPSSALTIEQCEGSRPLDGPPSTFNPTFNLMARRVDGPDGSRREATDPQEPDTQHQGVRNSDPRGAQNSSVCSSMSASAVVAPQSNIRERIRRASPDFEKSCVAFSTGYASLVKDANTDMAKDPGRAVASVASAALVARETVTNESAKSNPGSGPGTGAVHPREPLRRADEDAMLEMFFGRAFFQVHQRAPTDQETETWFGSMQEADRTRLVQRVSTGGGKGSGKGSMRNDLEAPYRQRQPTVGTHSQQRQPPLLGGIPFCEIAFNGRLLPPGASKSEHRLSQPACIWIGTQLAELVQYSSLHPADFGMAASHDADEAAQFTRTWGTLMSSGANRLHSEAHVELISKILSCPNLAESETLKRANAQEGVPGSTTIPILMGTNSFLSAIPGSGWHEPGEGPITTDSATFDLVTPSTWLDQSDCKGYQFTVQTATQVIG